MPPSVRRRRLRHHRGGPRRGDDVEARRRLVDGRRLGRAPSATSTATRSSGCRPSSTTTASARAKRSRRDARAGGRGARRASCCRCSTRATPPSPHGAADVEPDLARCCSRPSRRRASSRIDPGGRAVRPRRCTRPCMHEPGDGGEQRRRREPAHRLPVEGPRAAAGHGEGQGLAAHARRRQRGLVGAAARVVREGLLQGPRRLRDGDGQGDHDARTASWPASCHPDANPGDAAGRGALQGGLGRLRRRRRRGQAQGVRRGPPLGPGRRMGFGGARRCRRLRRRRRRRLQLPTRRPTSATCSAASSAARRRPAAAAAVPRDRVPSGATTSRPSCTWRSTTPWRASTTRSTSPARSPARPATARAPSPGTAPDDLPAAAAGAGVLDDNQGFFSFSHAVPAVLRRRGHRSITDPCPTCRGTGVERRPREVKVRIPAGVDDGQRIRLKGRGGAGRNGGPPGDLYVVVHVGRRPAVRPRRATTSPSPCRSPSPRRRSAPTSRCRPSTATRSRSGSRPARRSGKVFRVKGTGVEAKKAHGDLLVTVEVAVPTELTDEQREAVEALAATLPASRRESTWGCEPMTEPSDPRRRPDPGGLRHLGRRRAGRRAPADAAHLRAQGPARPGPHRRRQPSLQRRRHRPCCAASRSSPTRASTWPACKRVLELEAEIGRAPRPSWRGPGPRRRDAVVDRPTASTAATSCPCTRPSPATTTPPPSSAASPASDPTDRRSAGNQS